MPRSQRAAAHAAKSKFPNAVKLMKEADPEVKKEGNENKNKKRSASWKGTRPPKQNKGGKKGDSGGNGGCFGRTRSLTEKLRAHVDKHNMLALIDEALDASLKDDVAHLEPIAAADAKKGRELAASFDWGTTDVDKHNMSALIDATIHNELVSKHMSALVDVDLAASLKDGVAHIEPSAAAEAKKARGFSNLSAQLLHHMKELAAVSERDVAHHAEVNKSNSKLHSLHKLDSLLLHCVIYDVARDGTKMDGGGTMLGRKEDHLAWNVNKWGKVYENLDGKMCTATYEVDITNGVKVTETFQMLPAHFVKAMLSSMFDQGYHPHFSGVDFPSMKDLFWSMGWHFVFPEDAPQPISLVDVFRGMGYAGTWMEW